MAPRKVETGGRDLISSLPDELLSEILYLLPTQTAASTSILSKRWKNLLPLVHNLDFDKSTMVFASLISRTLVLLGDSPIHKFSLEWKSEKAQHLIYPLIYNALQREVLELHLISPKRQFVPSELFFSKTLVKLTLTLGCFARRNDNLVLDQQVWGSSIKRITTFYRSCGLDDYSCFIFKTPSLVFLDYSSYVAQDYLVQFDDSLVEARLDIRLWKYYDHVLPLPISYGYQLSKHGERGWQVLPLLLRKSPNLETLIINGLVHKITNLCGDVCVCDHGKMMRSCCLLSCRVKVLKVYGYEGSCGELNQMRHFLKNLRFLKLVKVKVQEQVNYLSLTNDLTKLLSTASSSNCKIQFI
ncbi:LOW QUALITY PROTEIN: hypothetical protein BRARA_H00020 [Brassica rapa]|uniref:F-box domain-containing protein n=1 Tax=Brassica campestris TaxID=3711 RepID=A0A397YEV8_BRACM|nr:LOW QUALITY PROTEIN: hypothetical protein BRARA_H00020 [Brassica rapa]